jgi:ribonuclease BN (tRNA processing enzyme)
MAGAVVVYISDHQQPLDGGMEVAPNVLELCDGADLLIHDAQYTPDEFVMKAHWGHCTVDYALHIAAEAGVRRLALFHHDPGHDDDFVDFLVHQIREKAKGTSVQEVIAASEGLTVNFDQVNVAV